MRRAQCRVEGGLEQVPRVRRLVSSLELQGEPRADTELVLSELVTNALLHGQGPVHVRLEVADPVVRVEVQDAGLALPVLPRESAEAMTGRGLGMVARLARSWGVLPRSPGKVVWADVPLHPQEGQQPELAAPEMDLDALLAAWPDDDPVVRHTVVLGAVPTRLLLAAKEHVDNLVRELTFASAGAEALPEPLGALTASVVAGFSEARSAIKRQAIAAAEADLVETQLVLSLPASAAEAGEAYLAGLDEADRFARAARLLTLETPATHRVFRRWYVQSLVDQLRASAEGRPAPPVQTFPERLSDEVAALSQQSSLGERFRSLHEVSAALAGVLTRAEVGRVVVEQGLRVLAAQSGGLAVVEGDGLVPVAARGYSDALLANLRRAREGDQAPALRVFRSGEPLWVESVAGGDDASLQAYCAAFEPTTAAMCAVPVVAGHRLGVMRFSFATERLFDEDERRFVLALADQAAVALERAELYGAERAAREDAEALAARLDLLTRVTADLTGARDVLDVVRVVTGSVTRELDAHTARVYLLREDDVLCSVGAVGGDALLADLYDEFPVAQDLPGSVALREGRAVVLPDRAALSARWPELAGIYPTERALVVLPLLIGEHRIGVMSLTFEHLLPETAFMESLADALSQALERTLATTAATAAGERLAFLSEASGLLVSSLDIRTTLAEVARLAVPRVADWCLVHLLQDDGVELVQVAHADREALARVEELVSRYPTGGNPDAGIGRVVRTGRPELVSRLAPEELARAAADSDHLRMLQGLGIRSVLIVPLTGRHGTYGALTLLLDGSGRHYEQADVSFVGDLGRRIALSLETATAFAEQEVRLAAVSRVAEAAQRAILAEPPPVLGPVGLAARYVSAAAEARIGGDLYEVVERDGAVRLLIGDVRGKGLEAVRRATVVLGEFRSAASDDPDLVRVCTQMDRRLRSHLEPEDFVTALVVEITPDGRCTLASCGHPPPLVVRGREVRMLDSEPSLPLGLGATPVLRTVQLEPGDRVLLHTDGLLEARAPDRRFLPLPDLVATLGDGDLPVALDRLLQRLRAATGAPLGDDLALLLAEYRGDPRGTPTA